MTRRVILSAHASDRPGLTRALADAIHEAGGNWLESHLSRLGGSYVGSVLIELPDDALAALEANVRAIDAAGLRVSLADAAPPVAASGRPLTIELIGQDRPGIVREVTSVLADLDVNIDRLDTSTETGAWSAEHLFRARANVTLPDALDPGEVQDALEAISGEIMVDFSFAQPET